MVIRSNCSSECSMVNMLLYVLSAYSLATFGLFTNGESTLPITTCKRNAVDYSACLKGFLQETWPRFIPGLPEFDFPTLDPLFYKYGTVVFDSGDIHAKVTLLNVTISGGSRLRFYNVRTHLLDDIFHLEIDTQVPRLIIKGAMKMNGSLGIFKIVDDANFNVTADDVRGTYNLTGHIINDTWAVEHFSLYPSVKNMQIYFDNLFQGNKELNDLAIIFVNEFWPALYRVMLPIAANTWDSWLVDIVNKIFLKVPFSKLFP